MSETPSYAEDSLESRKLPVDNHTNGEAIVLKDENHLYPTLDGEELPLNGNKYTFNHV